MKHKSHLRPVSLITIGIIVLAAVAFQPSQVEACSSWCATHCPWDCCGVGEGGLHVCGPSMCSGGRDDLSISETSIPVSLWKPLELPATTVKLVSPNRALITVNGYLLESMSGGACVSALSPVPGVARVNSIVAVLSSTGAPIDTMRFEPDATAGTEFASYYHQQTDALDGEESWQGFSASLEEGLEGGLHNSFVIDVTLEEGISASELIAALGRHGILGTGSAHADGTLENDHESIRHLGSSEIVLLQSSGKDPRVDVRPIR